MKITEQHKTMLQAAITAVLDNHPTAVNDYETGNFPRADKVRDLQKRFCFDLLALAVSGHHISTELYPYMHDDHIYTALRAVCPKVTRKY